MVAKIEIIDMRALYKQGDLVKLKENVRTPSNKYSKNDDFVVEDVNETTLYLVNEKGGLTIHRFLNNLIEKC